MLKPASLRQALCDAVPTLRNNPEMLRIFIDSGKIASTLAASLSFENQYTLNVVVTDYHGDLDYLIVPVNAWLRVNQPDIMTTDEGRKKGFTYIADINDDESIDISICLLLTERVIVREHDRELHVNHVPEPPLPELAEWPLKMYAGDTLVSQWHE